MDFIRINHDKISLVAERCVRKQQEIKKKLLKKMLTDKRLSSRIVRVVGSNR